MLRKDRERDAAFAWEVFQKAPYATLSLTDGEGKPYAIPISPVVDEAYHVVYFHCAGHGEKWELLAKTRRYACRQSPMRRPSPTSSPWPMPRRRFMAVRRWSPMKRSR